MLLDILAHYPWAMGVLLGGAHHSEQERLDKPCARVRIELATIKSSVDNSDHSANSYTLGYIKNYGLFKSRQTIMMNS